MKRLIILILFIIIAFNVDVYSAEKRIRLEIDTLNVTYDSVLVKVSVFTENRLVSESTGFIFHDIIRVPISRFTGNLIKRKLYVYRLYRQGESIEYLVDLRKIVTKYADNNEVSTIYFDSAGENVTRSEFYGDTLKIGPCGKVTGFYYIVDGDKSR